MRVRQAPILIILLLCSVLLLGLLISSVLFVGFGSTYSGDSHSSNEQAALHAQNPQEPVDFQPEEYREQNTDIDIYTDEYSLSHLPEQNTSEPIYDEYETENYAEQTNSPAQNPQKLIALTFDDGPSAYTDRIVDLLALHGGRSTFFVSGSRVMERRDTVVRAFNLGNEIANHTWSHPNLTTLSEEEIIYELQAACAVIESVVGVSPPMHRPPFGQSDERVVRISYELGYSIIKWTVDPLDWRYRDPDIVYNFIMDNVEAGSIILTHDTRPTTAAAMVRVIPRLIEEGFTLVTVTELLYHLYGGLTPGRIYGTYTILN